MACCPRIKPALTATINKFRKTAIAIIAVYLYNIRKVIKRA